MKIKLEIKNRITGKVLFEFETENNNTQKTLLEAIKQGAYLRGAYLRGAYLRGADLQGVKIKRAVVFTSLYKYIAIPFISEKNELYIRLGCYTRLLSEWESNFWNNNSEFPNNGSMDSKLRVFAFETCKKWLELNK